MSRPLRIEFPGAVYHVTSRGDRREPIYRDDEDRSLQLDMLAQAMDRFDAQVLSYCQMGNHFRLVLHTRQANLSRLMRHVNGVYTQAFNQRHGLVGHLFQGRFKAILVDRDAYLLALCRYVERNPVAAGMVAAAGDWPWSSYRTHVGAVATPPWLDSDGLHAYLLGRPVATARDRQLAVRRYATLVADAAPDEVPIWQAALRGQVFLGDEAFVARMQALATPAIRAAVEVPKAQRKPPLTLQACLQQLPGQPALALRRAYREGGITMTAMAKELRLSVSRVSRLIGAAELAMHARCKAQDLTPWPPHGHDPVAATMAAMIFWVDARLPPRLAAWLTQSCGLQAVALRDLGLRGAEHAGIFRRARAADAALISTDGDFVELITRHGAPPRLLWVTCGNVTNERLRTLFAATLPAALIRLEAAISIIEIGRAAGS